MVGASSKAKQHLDAGQLSLAIAEASQEVKANPTDARARTFLFELLCFAGEYDRAERQLDVLAHQSASAEGGVQVYRNILSAERARRRFRSDGLRPTFLTEEPDYARLHLEAMNRLREQRPTEAAALLEEAEELRPEFSGTLNGAPFSDFKDTDDLIGPFFEAFVQAQYVWLPFEQIKVIEIPAPERLRDLIWIAATVKGWEQPFGEVFLPVLYAGSVEQSDERVKLGRMTEWNAASDGGPVLGAGQRTFLVDGQEHPVLEVREVVFEGTAPQT